MISPAGQGHPVVIGPHYGNFSSVVRAFLSKDALLVARDPGDLLAKLKELKSNPEHAGEIARRALETVRANSGASERTLDALRPLFASFEARRAPDATGLSRSAAR